MKLTPAAIRVRLRHGIRRPPRYEPARYWEGRSRDLIETYDRPDAWAGRRWLRGGVEEEVVPGLLRRYECRTVLVPGAGSGRQYEFLGAFDVRGFDISPTLVSECQARYPGIETIAGDVLGCELLFEPVDAVVSSAVLAHIQPRRIRAAVASLQKAATKLIVIREYTVLDKPYQHQWTHPYARLLAPWQTVYREATDVRPGCLAELIAFASRP